MFRNFWAGLSTLSGAHRVWLVSIFGVYLVFLALLPPFQTNDEDAHFVRMWTLADGHMTCKPIPRSVFDFLIASDTEPVKRKAVYRWANIDAQLSLTGNPRLVQPGGAPCIYIPVSYGLPALVSLAVASPRTVGKPSRMFWSFYSARITNWFLATLATLIFLAFAPALRNLTLLMYSLPMAIHQQISINQESTILFLGLMLLLVWSWRPSLKQVVWMIALITVLSATKPVYLTLIGWWICALVRWRRVEPTRPRWTILTVSLLGLIPIALWLVWTVLVAGRPENAHYLPNWVNMPAQLAYLKAHPLTIPKIILIQIKDLFGRDHLRGGWISVMGVLGWAEIEIGDRAYYSLLAAVPLAALADFLSPSSESPPWASSDVGGRWWAFIWPIGAVASIIPAIAVAMYVQFNAVGAPYAMGTSGRYLYVPYFMMLAFGLDWLRLRWRTHARVVRWERLRPWLAPLCVLLVWIAEHDAINAILARFYHA